MHNGGATNQVLSDTYDDSSEPISPLADTNSQKPLISLASHDEKSSQITRTTEMYRVNWTTE